MWSDSWSQRRPDRRVPSICSEVSMIKVFFLFRCWFLPPQSTPFCRLFFKLLSPKEAWPLCVVLKVQLESVCVMPFWCAADDVGVRCLGDGMWNRFWTIPSHNKGVYETQTLPSTFVINTFSSPQFWTLAVRAKINRMVFVRRAFVNWRQNTGSRNSSAPPHWDHLRHSPFGAGDFLPTRNNP